jgi:hypothetical protein
MEKETSNDVKEKSCEHGAHYAPVHLAIQHRGVGRAHSSLDHHDPERSRQISGDYHEDNCRRLAPLWRMETEHIQVNCLPYQLREKQSISDHYSAIADLFF